MNKLTHSGIIQGFAITGNQRVRVQLRLTPSGSHWVTKANKKFRAKSGGQVVTNGWPHWYLELDSIKPL